MKNPVRFACLSVISTAALAALVVACSSTTTNNNTGTDGGPVVANPDGGGTTDPDGSTTNPDGGTVSTLPAATALHKVNGVEGNERISGAYCAPGSTTCVIAANGDTARLAAATPTEVSATPLVLADDALATKIGMVGSPTFLGFQKIGDKLVANLDTGASGFIAATGDPTLAASWTVTKLGHATPDDFALNHEYGFGFDGTTWVQMRHNSGVFTATGTVTSGWVNTWGPGGTPEVPADIATKKAGDATICDSAVSYSVSPSPVQAGYVAANAEIILYPAGTVNSIKSPDGAGICISTDKGTTFHIYKLAAEETAGHNGPTSVTCISKDKCFAAGGQISDATSAYLYYSDNASAGATSVWTKATIPAQVGDEFLNNIFFAPDGTHGWVVGAKEGHALLWTTTDAGHTWTDASTTVSGLADSELYAGFASDATHYIVGGKAGTLLSTF